MGLGSEIGAGAGFFIVGLVQCFSLVKAYRTNQAKGTRVYAKGKLRYVELVTIALLAIVHIIYNLVLSKSTRVHGFLVGNAISLEQTGVAAVFLLYAVTALLTEVTPTLPLPFGALQLIAVFAFGEEFVLFYFPSADEHRICLESHYHYLLLIPIGVCILSTAAEIACPSAFLAPLARSMALILQGTWFFQMGVSLFTKKWIAQGCELDQVGGGDYSVCCTDMKQLMRGKALATLQFNCHLAMLLLFLLPFYSVMSKLYEPPENYERLGGISEIEEERNFFQDKGRAQELSQADYFHVLEEDEVQSKVSTDSNAFHRVSI